MPLGLECKLWHRRERSYNGTMKLRGAIMISTVFLAFVLGIFTGRIFPRSSEAPHIKKIQAVHTGYRFTSPLLGIDVAHVSSFPEYRELENDVKEFIHNYPGGRELIATSIYFRNLSDGSWMGIGENEIYRPGSLFKVPIMLAYLKEAETHPAALKKLLTFDDPTLKSDPQDIPPRRSIEFGRTYTVEELMDYMIVYSDNNAANLLANGIYLDARNSYTEMMRDLGLSVFADEISAKGYSLFLRILYNATYLSPEMSEKALSILSKVDFEDGLAGSIPSDTPISHKFGEVGYFEAGKFIQELHECGIVYVPEKNYLLCVMTKGHNKVTQIDLINQISRKIFEFVDKSRGE
jgi:beta-lactamase class A